MKEADLDRLLDEYEDALWDDMSTPEAGRNKSEKVLLIRARIKALVFPPPAPPTLGVHVQDEIKTRDRFGQ